MAASEQTVQDVVKALLRHMSRADAKALLDDLVAVKGNESFRQTVQAVLWHLEER